MSRADNDPEHAEALRLAIFGGKIVIRKLPVPELPAMDLRAWYVYLPCGASFYIGKYSQSKIQQAIDHDDRSHQRMRDRAKGRVI